MGGETEFQLGDDVRLAMSNETGKVIGKAEYLYESRKYFVQYVAAEGRQVEGWFAFEQLA